MESALQQFIRKRARQRGLSLAALCRQAGISRQTLYDAWAGGSSLPSLHTLVGLSVPLEVHPLRLLQLLFVDATLPASVRRLADCDRSAFVSDVSHPDGASVLACSQFVKTWRLANAGATPWVGRKLVCMDDYVAAPASAAPAAQVGAALQPEAREIDIPPTLPGEEVELSVRFTAPPHPCSVMSYWKMALADGTLCFPEATGIWVKVQVIAPTSCAGSTLQEDLRWIRD